MRVKMLNYGSTFDLHCPKCGNKEWSEKTYNSGVNLYRKCMHCGADVCTDTHTNIGIVVEEPFKVFDEHTYDKIREYISLRIWD